MGGRPQAGLPTVVPPAVPTVVPPAALPPAVPTVASMQSTQMHSFFLLRFFHCRPGGKQRTLRAIDARGCKKKCM